MEFKIMKYYSEEHEWVELNGNLATVGISSYAADELGDLTFVELPEVDAQIANGDSLCVVESVKAASDVFSPVSGTVVEINIALEENPALINTDAETNGWLCKILGVNEDELTELMNEEEYEDFISGLN